MYTSGKNIVISLVESKLLSFNALWHFQHHQINQLIWSWFELLPSLFLILMLKRWMYAFRTKYVFFSLCLVYTHTNAIFTYWYLNSLRVTIIEINNNPFTLFIVILLNYDLFKCHFCRAKNLHEAKICFLLENFLNKFTATYFSDRNLFFERKKTCIWTHFECVSFS